MTIGIGSEAALGVVHQGSIRAADRSNLAVRPSRGRVCVRYVAVAAGRDCGGTGAGLLTSRTLVRGALRLVLDRSDAALRLLEALEVVDDTYYRSCSVPSLSKPSRSCS